MSAQDLPPDDLQQAEPPPVELTSDDKMWGMFCHLAAILTTYTVAMGFLGPLIVWLIKKDQSKFVDYQGREALNFQLTILIAELICIPLICVVVGIFLLIGLGVYSLILSIIAGLNANSGQWYRYPLTLRFIK
jgi:uncharacterized Tic20 family protein